MAPKLKTEDKIEALRQCVEQQPKIEATQCLKKALQEKSNFLVAKAAQWTSEQLLYDLIPELVSAYERFLHRPLDNDKTCAAKRAIARALYELDYDDAGFFRKNITYCQIEPVYGGSVDTAVDLRCTCALGLVASGDPRAVLYLLNLLHDDEYQARIGAIKAFEMVQPFHAEIALRNKILQGDAEPEVIAQSFSSLIKVAAEESLEFVSPFLKDDEPATRESAAMALGESRLDEALELLIEHTENLSPFDSLLPGFYNGIALQRKETAYQYLLDKISDASEQEASHAVAALSIYNYNSDLSEAVAVKVKSRKSKKVTKAFETCWEQ